MIKQFGEVRMVEVVVLVLALAVGFGGGLGVSGKVGGAKAAREAQEAQVRLLEAQADGLRLVAEGQRALAAEMSKPLVVDGEIRAALAGVPVQCVRDLGGDPMDIRCAWATCIQHGASSAQRPECREVEKAMLEVIRR
jgi:hypothetical protein